MAVVFKKCRLTFANADVTESMMRRIQWDRGTLRIGDYAVPSPYWNNIVWQGDVQVWSEVGRYAEVKVEGQAIVQFTADMIDDAAREADHYGFSQDTAVWQLYPKLPVLMQLIIEHAPLNHALTRRMRRGTADRIRTCTLPVTLVRVIEEKTWDALSTL